jgi:hypothetical protein
MKRAMMTNPETLFISALLVGEHFGLHRNIGVVRVETVILNLFIARVRRGSGMRVFEADLSVFSPTQGIDNPKYHQAKTQDNDRSPGGKDQVYQVSDWYRTDSV